MPKRSRWKPRFEAVDASYKPDAEEQAIIRFWEQGKIFERSVTERPADRTFVFFEGPPTANGKPGLHHVETRAFKDVIPRYQTMRGRRVERKAGWDTHGLPVELQVEKELGISGKPQIENIVPGDVRASIAKFNALCRASVWRYQDEWERLTKRVGFWLDLDHPYITYERTYIESVWWVLKQLWEKQLLYEDFKVVPYCPRCGTALSSHEVALGYEETTDRSVYVKFPVIGEEKTYLLAWTTTPWTLPGNVALAVGTDIEYVKVFDEDTEETYYLAKHAMERLGYSTVAQTTLSPESREHQVRGEIKGTELVGKSYQPLFSVSALTSPTSYRVYPADFVTTDDGTGIVHTAVMYGEDDFQLGSERDLPKHHTVDLEGKFTSDVPDFEGLFVKDETTEQRLIEYLRDGNALLREEPCPHTYPFCWRCQTPLIYYAKRSWFIRMSSLRDRLIEQNATVQWVPPHLRDGRFGEWLRELKDWALSRDRYWGTPLPIWHCDRCHRLTCIGSFKELAQLSGQTIDDPHKPFIDDIRWPCTAPTCQGTLTRYPEVIDVWFDSGAMPFAQWHYPFSEEAKRRVDDGQNYPADYITEGIDQTRGWFYTLLALATALDREAPYRSVISLGLVLDKNGKKMSKSRGNIADPWPLVNEHGADALRFYMYSVNQPGDPKKFDPINLLTVVRKVLLIYWNCYGYFAQRAGSIGCDSIERPATPAHVLDEWLVTKIDSLVKNMTNYLDSLDLYRAAHELSDFVTELSTWYIKHSRSRADAQFVQTLGWALHTSVRLAAPLIPFMSEQLWQRLRADDEADSVHLAPWPTSQSVRLERLREMEAAQSAVTAGLSARAQANLHLRQPLASAKIHGGSPLPGPLLELVREALNVQAIHQASASRAVPRVTLDTHLTDELRVAGLARSITRAIQQLRKNARLTRAQSVTVVIGGSHPLDSLIKEALPTIAAATTTVIRRLPTVAPNGVTVEGLSVSLAA